MATFEEVVKFRIDASTVSPELGAAQEALRALKDQVQQYKDALAKGTITQVEFGRSVLAMGQDFKKAYADIRALTGGVDDLDKSKKKASGGKFAYYLSSIAQAAQDAQYGLKNVENNVLAMTSAMGPWGVAIGIGVVGAIELYTHWDDIAKIWDEGGTKTEAERMEALAKATHRTVEETKALRDWERRESIVKAGGGPKKEEAGFDRALSDVFRENGPIEEIAAKLLESEQPGVLSEAGLLNQANPSERRAIDRADSMLKGTINPKTGERVAPRAEEGKKLREETIGAIRDRLLKAAMMDLAKANDPASMAAVAERLEKAGQGDLARQVRDIYKREPMGPPKPDDRTMMAQEMKRFNETGESDVIAGPGRWHDRIQKPLQDFENEQIDTEFDREQERLDQSNEKWKDRKKEREQERRKQDRERKERDRNIAADFEADNPGFRREALKQLYRSMLGGKSFKEAENGLNLDLAKQLRDAGMSPDEAKKKAADMTRDVRAGLNQQRDQWMNSLKAPEITRASDINAKVQQAGFQKQEDLIGKQLVVLNEIRDALGKGVPTRVWRAR